MIDIANAVAKYVIALVVVVGCFVLIYSGHAGSDNTQAWSAIALIVGWLIRDSAGNSATANLVRAQSSSPTVTTSSGQPPVTTTVTPTANGG